MAAMEPLRSSHSAGASRRELDVPLGAIPPSNSTTTESSPPGGRFRAYTQVLAAFLASGLTWGFSNSFGVYQLYYEEALDLPSSQVSWIGSVQTFLAFAMSAPAGRLADAGYTRHIVATGSVLATLGIFMTSLATNYWQILLAQGICTGIGLGIIYIPTMSLVGSYFVEKKASAIAVATTGSGFGSIIFPAMVQYLIPQVGFAWAVRCSGFVAFTMLAISNLLLRPYLPPRRTGPVLDWAAFREPPFLFFLLGSFLTFYALFFGFFYMNVYAHNVIGFSPAAAVTLLFVTNASSVPARLLSGYVADRALGPINTFVFSTLILGATLYGWAGVSRPAEMFAFSAFFGAATGACQATFLGANASLTKDLQKLGTRLGMTQTIIGFATLAGSPTAGAIIDRSGGRFLGAQIWGGSLVIAGSACIIASRVAAAGREVWVKI